MDNFDLKKYLVENKVTARTTTVQGINENIIGNLLGGIIKSIPLPREILFEVIHQSIEEIRNVFKTEYSEDQAKEFIKILKKKVLDREIKTINDVVRVVQAEKDKIRK